MPEVVGEPGKALVEQLLAAVDDLLGVRAELGEPGLGREVAVAVGEGLGVTSAAEQRQRERHGDEVHAEDDQRDRGDPVPAGPSWASRLRSGDDVGMLVGGCRS